MGGMSGKYILKKKIFASSNRHFKQNLKIIENPGLANEYIMVLLSF
jgi:hypothetical protein